MICNDILSLLDQCFAEPSSEKLPSAEDGKKHRDSQIDILWKVRDLEVFSST